MSPSCLKACTDQLAPIFTQICTKSLELCEAPSCFKCYNGTIIQVPKNHSIRGFNGYRLVALTSVITKSSPEKRMCVHPKDIKGPLLAILQFAYQANQSVTYSQHGIVLHSAAPLHPMDICRDVMVLLVGSAFNTII